MATVSLPGGPTLNYREWGRPDAAVVLLLHGLTSSSQSWRHVAPELGEHFRVIAPDARGHGGSEWMRDYSFESMRDDVARFMEQVGILAAIVIGHSMGAVTAYDLAITRPDLIRLLVLEEMPPGWWERAAQIQARTLVLGAAHSDLRQDRMEELSRHIPQATFASMNSNHGGHEERPSEFLIQVEPFISWFAKQ